MMIKKVRLVPQASCCAVGILSSLMVCLAHHAMAQQAEEIEAANILEQWADSRLTNVKIGFVHTIRYYQALEIFDIEPSLDPNYQNGRAVREKEFYYKHDVGMRQITLTGLGRDVGILDGEGISITDPGSSQYSPYTVNVYEDGQNSPIMIDSVTHWFLLWFNPTQAKIASDISEGSISSFTLRSDSDWGTIAIADVLGGDTEESFVLAKQFDWRPVRIDTNRFGQPASRIEIDYYRDDAGRLCMEGLKWTKFQPASSEIRSVSRLEIDSIEFDSVRREDLELEIPPKSILNEHRDGQEHKFYIKKSGEKVAITVEDVRNHLGENPTTEEREAASRRVVAHLESLQPDTRYGPKILVLGVVLLGGCAIFYWVKRRRSR